MKAVYSITFGPHFRHDVTNALERNYNFSKLRKVIKLLECGIKLPRSYRQHALNRTFLGFNSVHIEPDWLLIYRLDGTVLELARLGTHQELYSSRRERNEGLPRR